MKKAFTLIELLIVVAIIAILAAIAVPNFLEAQVRSKISHELSNMRTNRTALAAYRVDNTEYPPDSSLEKYSFKFLTTPVAYISSIPDPVFNEYRIGQSGSAFPGETGALPGKFYSYWGGDAGNPDHAFIRSGGYAINCAGPDETRIISPRGVTPRLSIGHDEFWNRTSGNGFFRDPTDKGTNGYSLIECLYDPTNGTVSSGDIVATHLGMMNIR